MPCDNPHTCNNMGDTGTIIDLFYRQVERYSARVALRVKKAGRYTDISWDEFGRRVVDFSLGLMALGMRRGDNVTLLSRNRPEFAYADLAILSAGAVTVPIYPSSVAEDVAYVFNHADANLLIADRPDQLEKVRSVRPALTRLTRIILMEGEEEVTDEGVISFESVCQIGRQVDQATREQWSQWRHSITPEDIATIIYTSGTTGRPKGVMIAHTNIMFVCRSLQQAFSQFMSDQSVYLSYLPLAHALERMGLFVQIYMGSTTCFAERLETVGENIAEIRPTSLVGVPRFYEKIHQRILSAVGRASPRTKRVFSWALRVGREHRLAREENRPVPLGLTVRYALARPLVFDKLMARLGGRVQYAVSGAAPLPLEVAEFFADIGLPILEGYGATEVCGPATLNRAECPRIGTVGSPIPGVEVRIAEDGEILVKGGSVFQGYFKDKVATDLALRDGWYYSGDVGSLDERGDLVVSDRKKDLIITSSGKNVAPQKLESFFKASELISEIIIIGDRRNYLTALITLSPEKILQIADYEGIQSRDVADLVHHPRIRALVGESVAERNSHLASFEQIKKFSILDEEFTIEGGILTPTMKIKRRVAAEKYADRIEQMYNEGTGQSAGAAADTH